MRSIRLAFLLLGASAMPAFAQIQPAPTPASIAVPPDSIAHRPGPFSYFFRSLAIPGWGQASLDRKLTGGLFVAFEGLAISMALKTSNELRFLDRADTAAASSRRAERQDWIVLIAFNHLFSAMEAYVSAHLLDFPADLHMQALPGGRTGVLLTLPLWHH
jgi:hypothetical protein